MTRWPGWGLVLVRGLLHGWIPRPHLGIALVAGCERFAAPAISRLWFTPQLHRPDGTHFDRSVLRGRAPSRPAQSSVEIGHVNQVVASQLLLRFRKGTVENLGFAVGGAQGGCGSGWTQPV